MTLAPTLESALAGAFFKTDPHFGHVMTTFDSVFWGISIEPQSGQNSIQSTYQTYVDFSND